MSVPPDIEDKCTSDLIFLYTYSKLSSERGDPVEHIVFKYFNFFFFETFNLFKESIYFALTPNNVIFWY